MSIDDARVLVVDDDPFNRELLAQALAKEGCEVTAVEDGMRALRVLRSDAMAFDLILLDVMMPGMDGYDVLSYLKGDPGLARVPVIVISAIDDLSSVVKCLELGADDYLTKPFDSTLLRARIGNSLARKRHTDAERRYVRLLEQEEARADRLILNVLPAGIADRLKIGETLIADDEEDASLLFADVVGFTSFAEHRDAGEVVRLLDAIMTGFDKLAAVYGIEKIKTIGDSYFAAGGLTQPRGDDYLAKTVEMAYDMLETIAEVGDGLTLRIGIHAGPVVAGVIGMHKFTYDLWGDSVNVASRMESHGVPGRIQVSEAVRDRLAERLTFEDRGTIDIKNRGQMRTFLAEERPERRALPDVLSRPVEPPGWLRPDEILRRD